MYLYNHVEYLQFLRMEFSCLSTVGDSEVSFSSFPLFSQISLSVHLPPPPCYSFPLLSSLPYGNHLFSTQQLFNGRHALVFFCAVGGQRDNGVEEIYLVNFSVPTRDKTIDSKYRQRCDLNYTKDWDLWLDPSLTPSCGGRSWVLSQYVSSCPVWKKC